MNFLSLTFLAFVAVILLLYYAVPKSVQKYVILLANLGFILSFSKRNTLFLFGMILISYIGAKILKKKKEKALLTAVILISLAPLLLFKYVPIDLSGILVPIGVSFFTFRMISYIVEVYQEKQDEVSFIDYAIYISFFPTLVSGPIDRPQEFLPQIREKHFFQEENIRHGFLLMVYGFLMKMVLADRLAMIVNTVFTNWGGYSGFALFFTSLLYTLQIYCDFAGYTHIAMGVAKCMDIDCRKNFEQPYFAESIQDFWRRWHISLSTWLRDYVYIPLGGNRKGKVRKYINLMITFLVSGLWHGAGLKFLLWGGVHGAYQVIGALTKKKRTELKEKLQIQKRLRDQNQWIEKLITFLLINFAWVLFWGSSLHASCHILLRMLQPSAITFGWIHTLGITDVQVVVLILCTLLVFYIDKQKEKKTDVAGVFYQMPLPVRWAILLLMISVIVAFGAYGPGYNAASFIYFQF